MNLRCVHILALACCCAAVFGRSESHVADARQVLTDGARESDPAHRREVALALGLLNQREAANLPLRKLAADSDVEVRVAAISSIADLRSLAYLPDLNTALEDPVPEVAFAAAKSLWALKQPAGKEVLLSVLEGETKVQSSYVKRRYRGMLRSFSTPKGAILFTLNQGIGFVPLPGVGAGFSALQALLFEKDFSPRASVAISLAHDKDAQTRTALVEALSDADWSVRAAAAQALGMRNEAALRDKLVPLLNDSSHRVRYRAAASYLRLAALR